MSKKAARPIRPVPPRQSILGPDFEGDEPPRGASRERMDQFLAQVRYLREGLLGAGFQDEDNIVAIILDYLAQEGIG